MIRTSTVRLPVAVVVSVGGALTAVMTGRPEAALLAAPWAVLLVLGLGSSKHDRIRAAVDVEADRILVGDDVQLDVTVEAETAGLVEIRPTPGPTFGPRVGQGARAPVISMADVIEPGRPLTIRCPLAATEWGTHDVGRVEIKVIEPYGLTLWSGVSKGRKRVRVHPPPAELRRLVAPWLVRRLSGAHQSTATDRGIEYADIRPFASGDSLRDINWRVSARSEEIWVSERHPERATDVVLLLDSFVESGHDVRSVFGVAIEAAIALAESHLAKTDRIGLVELGGVVRWVTPGTGRLQLQRLTDGLLATGLYANASDRDLMIVPPRALPPRSFVVALSPLLDSRFIDALFALRGAGHDVVVIDCLGELEGGSGTGSEASYLAHRFWEAERLVVRDRLAERGMAVGLWQRGRPLDSVLRQLTQWRHRARWAHR